MLVLTRKINQSIVVGEDVRIVVVGIEGDKVKIGIDAPPDCVIRRVKDSPPKAPTSR